jgi:hypothetical protein
MAEEKDRTGEYLKPGDDLPDGYRLNSFTGALRKKNALSLAPSPADQQILASVGDKPLIELCAEVVNSIGDDTGAKHSEGATALSDTHPRLTAFGHVPQTQSAEGPLTPDESDELVQHTDVLPTNAQAVADGALIADSDTETEKSKGHKKGTKHGS